MNVCVFWGRDVGRWKEGSAKTQLPMRALLRHSIQKTSLRRYRPSGFVMDQLVKRRPEVDSFSHHVGELNSNSQSSRTLNRYETGHKRERRAFAVVGYDSPRVLVLLSWVLPQGSCCIKRVGRSRKGAGGLMVGMAKQAQVLWTATFGQMILNVR